MEALSAAGVPVLALRGAQGGWELAQGWRTKVPGLDEAELQRAAHVTAQRARASRAGGGLGARLWQADGGDAAQHADPGRVHPRPAAYRPGGLAPISDDLSMLPIVQDAIARDCKLTFLYSRADGESGVRTVDPFGIVSKQAVWYLVARAPAGMRTYRISRMQNAVVLAVTFERPANFDLAAHWKSTTAQLQPSESSFAPRSRLLPMQPSHSDAGARSQQPRKYTRRSRTIGLCFMFRLRAAPRRDSSFLASARALVFLRRQTCATRS